MIESISINQLFKISFLSKILIFSFKKIYNLILNKIEL